MLATHTSNLTPEQQQRLHPDFVENERAYLRMRSQLLTTHYGLWVAVDAGEVVAFGSDLRAVFDQAVTQSDHPYVARVGLEDSTVFRVRREETAYDSSYQPFAMPILGVRFFDFSETHSQRFDDVIPDTGADTSMLPETDCLAFDLLSGPCLTAMSGGVSSPLTPTLIYRAKAELNALRVDALVQPMHGSRERLIGRDVLNHHRVTFDGPRGRVTVEP